MELKYKIENSTFIASKEYYEWNGSAGKSYKNLLRNIYYFKPGVFILFIYK